MPISQQPSEDESKGKNMNSIFGGDTDTFFSEKFKSQTEEQPKKLPGSDKGLCIRNGKMSLIDQM